VNVLVLRALGLGDLATAVPALRGLRVACPGARIELAAPNWLAPLVALTGAVDCVLPTPDLRPLPVAAPDIGVNLHGSGPESHHSLRTAAPRRMLAYACPDAAFGDGPKWDEREREVDRWSRLLAWYGIASDPTDLGLRRPAAASPAPGATVIHPGAKSPRRRWPPSFFAAVARALAHDGHRVVVTGDAAERPLAESVARKAGLGVERVLAGRTRIDELAALVASARLVISGDTGVAHLATAYEIPSVVLFGPVPPAVWGPPPDRPRHRALWHETVDDGGRVHPALLRIAPDHVIEAAACAEAAR
jgi:ADP-heptose:LPS heptosyltransferase